MRDVAISKHPTLRRSVSCLGDTHKCHLLPGMYREVEACEGKTERVTLRDLPPPDFGPASPNAPRLGQ